MKPVDLRENFLWDVFSKDYHMPEKGKEAYLEKEQDLEISISEIKPKIMA